MGLSCAASTCRNSPRPCAPSPCSSFLLLLFLSPGPVALYFPPVLLHPLGHPCIPFNLLSLVFLALEPEGLIHYSFADPTVWSDARLRDGVCRDTRIDAKIRGVREHVRTCVCSSVHTSPHTLSRPKCYLVKSGGFPKQPLLNLDRRGPLSCVPFQQAP